MASSRTVFSAALTVLLLAGCGQTPPPAAPEPLDTSVQKPPSADPSQPVASGNTPAAADIAALAALNGQYDPSRNPYADLETAKVEAKRGGKRILLEVGGQWCQRCQTLDELVSGDAELRSLRDAHYVWVKVNYSQENDNAAFLSQYPRSDEYPQLLVLDDDGRALQSPPIDSLRRGERYDRAGMLAYLKQWARPQA